MKHHLRLAIVCCSTLIIGQAIGQSDTIRLICPFENGSGREPREAFTWDPPEKKIVMITKKDTIIRSCYDATVSNVNPTEDQRYEVVIYHKDYYFWYYGVAQPFIKRGDVLKAGQPLGKYIPGTEVEFRMFRKEEAIDPRKFIDCKMPNED